jgi:hypothetical protein
MTTSLNEIDEIKLKIIELEHKDLIYKLYSKINSIIARFSDHSRRTVVADFLTMTKRMKRNKTMTLVDEFYLDQENVHPKRSIFKKLQRSLSNTLVDMKYLQRSLSNTLVDMKCLQRYLYIVDVMCVNGGR